MIDLLPLPAVLVIEPTNRCNMRCVMCPQEQQLQVGDMSVEVLECIVNQLTQSVKYIQFYFVGEPTLHPTLPEMIELIKRNSSAKVEVSTNLVALRRRECAERFLISGVDRVLCCIEGFSEVSHKALRKTGSFSHACNTVHMLADIKRRRRLLVDIIVKCIETVHNQGEISDFTAYWQSVHGVTPSVTWMNTWAASMPHLGSIGVHGGPNALYHRSPCAEIWNKMVIRWNGTVVICCHDWSSQVPLGQIQSSTLLEIWNGHIINGIRKEHLNGKFSGICWQCKEWSISSEFITDYKLNYEDIIQPGYASSASCGLPLGVKRTKT